MEEWRAQNHVITVINGDAQRADWRTGPEIVDVIPGTANASGKVPLTIKGARLVQGAILEVAGAPVQSLCKIRAIRISSSLQLIRFG
jgi:hypothetical protein